MSALKSLYQEVLESGIGEFKDLREDQQKNLLSLILEQYMKIKEINKGVLDTHEVKIIRLLQRDQNFKQWTENEISLFNNKLIKDAVYRQIHLSIYNKEMEQTDPRGHFV